MTTSARPKLSEVGRRALGRPTDWNLRRPNLNMSRPSLAWTGLLIVSASVAVAWFAFSGAQGEEGSVQYGLFIGSASIVLMAWSFVLALRPKTLEPIFGGLDQMYRLHRWAGSLAIVAMWLHTGVEPEVEDGIRGSSESVADTARDLAGTGQTMLYILVGISLIRWFPYRYWRLTHKLLGVPFVFASWHFFTAEKTYDNNSPWGWWFGGIMLAGIAAWLLRVIGRDMLRPGVRHRVTNVARLGSTTEIRLAAVNRKFRYRVGQFAVVKLQTRGLREPHVFTIASGPEEDELRFFIRDLGDWTSKVQTADLIGSEVIVEGPYGQFAPLPEHPAPTVWIAGGVGITPFLSAASSLPPAPPNERPLLLYAVRDRADATALEVLERAVSDGVIRLEVFASSEGRRFDEARLAELVGDSLRGGHAAICGPASLVTAASRACRSLGVRDIETEAFDIRSGFGPDLSTTVEELLPSNG